MVLPSFLLIESTLCQIFFEMTRFERLQESSLDSFQTWSSSIFIFLLSLFLLTLLLSYFLYYLLSFSTSDKLQYLSKYEM